MLRGLGQEVNAKGTWFSRVLVHDQCGIVVV